MRGDTEITNSEDIIDSRDIMARIEYLQEERDSFESPEENEAIADKTQWALWGIANPSESEELSQLNALAEQCEGYGDWAHGETLIRDSYFQEYAESLAEDIGAIDANAKWPLNHIDWPAAADELKADYTSADFDGITYWMRS